MLVSELVQKTVQPLSTESQLFDIHAENYPDSMDYIPVVDAGKFIGLFPLKELETEREVHTTIGQCHLERILESVSENQHLFEVLVVFQKSGFNLLPVLGEDSEYEGFLVLENVISVLSETYSFQADGGILVLSVANHDYSLSEISRLIESNQAKILNVLVASDPFSHQNLFIHIKINQIDLSRIVATLERFEYNVVEIHHISESNSLDKERLDMLMKYLGI